MVKTQIHDPASKTLLQRIKQFEEAQARPLRKNAPQNRPQNDLGMAGRVFVELVAGLMVGGGAGWLLDQWLDTTPLFMIVMFFVGAGAGMMNVWRAVKGYDMAAGYFNETATKETTIKEGQ